MKKYVIFLLFFLIGCVSTKTLNQAILLPEDRIYTVPAGQMISVLLDGKPLEMTFPADMKLVSTSTLVRQEEQLNSALFKATKSQTNQNRLMTVIGGIIAIISGFFAFRKKAKT